MKAQLQAVRTLMANLKAASPNVLASQFAHTYLDAVNKESNLIVDLLARGENVPLSEHLANTQPVSQLALQAAFPQGQLPATQQPPPQVGKQSGVGDSASLFPSDTRAWLDKWRATSSTSPPAWMLQQLSNGQAPPGLLPASSLWPVTADGSSAQHGSSSSNPSASAAASELKARILSQYCGGGDPPKSVSQLIELGLQYDLFEQQPVWPPTGLGPDSLFPLAGTSKDPPELRYKITGTMVRALTTTYNESHSYKDFWGVTTTKITGIRSVILACAQAPQNVLRLLHNGTKTYEATQRFILLVKQRADLLLIRADSWSPEARRAMDEGISWAYFLATTPSEMPTPSLVLDGMVMYLAQAVGALLDRVAALDGGPRDIPGGGDDKGHGGGGHGHGGGGGGGGHKGHKRHGNFKSKGFFKKFKGGEQSQSSSSSTGQQGQQSQQNKQNNKQNGQKGGKQDVHDVDG
jgi:hypothetical protein